LLHRCISACTHFLLQNESLTSSMFAADCQGKVEAVEANEATRGVAAMRQVNEAASQHAQLTLELKKETEEGLRLARESAEAKGLVEVLREQLSERSTQLQAALTTSEEIRAERAETARQEAKQLGELEAELGRRDARIAELQARQGELVEQLEALSSELEKVRDAASERGEALGAGVGSELAVARQQIADLQEANEALLSAQQRLDQRLAELQEDGQGSIVEDAGLEPPAECGPLELERLQREMEEVILPSLDSAVHPILLGMHGVSQI
jgi:chromosome segregation ATPase